MWQCGNDINLRHDNVILLKLLLIKISVYLDDGKLWLRLTLLLSTWTGCQKGYPVDSVIQQ